MKTAMEILGPELLAELRANGFAVVHSQPTGRMLKEAVRKGEWPEDMSAEKYWHRMVGASVKQQNSGVATDGH